MAVTDSHGFLKSVAILLKSHVDDLRAFLDGDILGDIADAGDADIAVIAFERDAVMSVKVGRDTNRSVLDPDSHADKRFASLGVLNDTADLGRLVLVTGGRG